MARDDAHYYTSVHQWKPITPEQFANLLHGYTTSIGATDEHGNGKMTSKTFNLDRIAQATIHYLPRSQGSAISSPVLMTMGYPLKDRVICFASTQYGKLAEPI